MTELERGIGLMVQVFSRYSTSEGNKQTLTKSEVKTLMEKELPGFLQSGKDNDTVDKLIKDLDANGDTEVDFNEFVVFVATLASICHSFFVKAAPM